VPPLPSPRGIWQAIWQLKSETSKVSTRRAAFVPSVKRFQETSTPQPSGETKPMPVITTRRITPSRDPVGTGY
jgi:hypothetical protein